MGYYLSLPILIIAAALQSSVMPQLRIAGGAPDLVLLLVLLWAIHAPLNEAIFWAFLGGLSQDLLSVMPLGSSVIGMLIMIFFIKRLSLQLYRVNIVLVAGYVLLGTIVQTIITQIILFLMGLGLSIGDAFQYVLMPTLFYQLVFLVPVYLVIRGIQRAIYPRPGSRL
ncbi:rod shape-determining protein MreD [Phototrophicus methaneseepsis]|uniref:Rod shape-determining protein MreD n=1 Tax=Phototrophicus methaneseepsis TaxID=2710758 RepID=A0A7S8E7A9_9CHLR|nr:rod shape-determining protein MreD [Phototrophicus methaneseepsis]QPC81623.1 rod shape-determining protein MreD [Phototrophicus methaneseepsis]